MLEKFLALLSAPPAPVRDPAGLPFARREIAVVALLVAIVFLRALNRAPRPSRSSHSP